MLDVNYWLDLIVLTLLFWVNIGFLVALFLIYEVRKTVDEEDEFFEDDPELVESRRLTYLILFDGPMENRVLAWIVFISVAILFWPKVMANSIKALFEGD